MEVMKQDLLEKIEKKTTSMSAKYLQSMEELRVKKKQLIKETA